MASHDDPVGSAGAAAGRSGPERVTGRVLVVDDERGIRTLVSDVLRRAGHEVEAVESADEALKLAGTGPGGSEFDLVIADIHMPGMDGIELCRRLRAERSEQLIVLITGYPTIENAVRGMKEGARDYVTKPLTPDELRLCVSRALEERALRQENRRLRAELDGRYELSGIIGKSKVMRELFAVVEKVARSESTVLLHGESGTGKELFARAIHSGSPRKRRPFVTINCGSLVETLLESELFGHMKGAFTGATATKPGLFAAADSGTFFMDEIGELSPAAQAKLLRVLQEGEVKPVGGVVSAKVDVRVVAATHRDLREGVASGRFREDLFYRLNVITLEIPPLRDRREDIPILAETFLLRSGQKQAASAASRGSAPPRPPPELSPAAHEYLMAQSWPGNVRELLNAVERAVILAAGPVLGPDDFRTPERREPPPPAMPQGASVAATDAGTSAAAYAFEGMSLDQLERLHIERVLTACEGQKGRAADILGINRTTLWKKLRQYGLDEDRSPGDPSDG